MKTGKAWHGDRHRKLDVHILSAHSTQSESEVG